MAILFDEILAQGIRKGLIPAREKKARDWYRERAKNVGKMNEASMFKQADRDRLTARPKIGQLFMYYYDPKHKATLPYYDIFPLVFPFRKVKGGFLGINLHYLPLVYRAKLMDSLYEISNNNHYDESTKLNLSYKVLNSSSKFEYFKPCVKHYLTGHLRSRLLYIYPSEWDIALWLPLERFQKKSKSQVWAESKKKIKG